MLIVFIRAIILYAVVVFSIRLMGKRQIGELQPSELVITILVSNIATLPIEDTSIPMIIGIVPILALVSLDVIMSAITLKSKRLRRIISGNPKVIISNGVIDQDMMKRLRYSVDDLMESLRDAGIFDIDEIQYAIVETTGKISVMQKPQFTPLTQGDITVFKTQKNPPQIIIDDGVILDEVLDFLKLSRSWLNNVLRENHIKAKDIYILSATDEKDVRIIKKEDKKWKE